VITRQLGLSQVSTQISKRRIGLYVWRRWCHRPSLRSNRTCATLRISLSVSSVLVYCRVLRPHSIILASCKPGFRPGLQPGFRQVRVGLRHAFDFFLSKTWSRTCCINLDMSRLMQQVRWFVCVLDKWNVEKAVSSQPTTLFKLDFRYVFFYSCLSWRN